MMSRIKESFASINWSSVKANKLLIAWLVFGAAAVLVPPVQWQIQRGQFYRNYGKYVAYEQQQRQYEEAQNQNNNDGNNDGYYYSSYYKACAGWNWICRAKQEKYAQQYFGDNNNNNNNGYDENGNPVADTQIPAWFQLMSGSSGQSEAMRRWQEENTGVRQEDNEEEAKATAGEIFVTIYMMLAVLAMVTYGINRLYQGGLENLGNDGVKGLVVALVLVLNLLFLNLLLAPSLVSVEDRMMEDSVYGWYGQIGVLMIYISFYGMLFCTGFLVAFYFIFFRAGKETPELEAQKEGEFVPGDYVAA